MRWALVLPFCFVMTTSWAKDTPTPTKIDRKGPYLGVQPGTQDLAPNTSSLRSRGAIRLITWVGFQMRGQGGRVFIQGTEPPVYELIPGNPDEIVIAMPNSRLHSKNNRRSLDTGWFPTAVLNVKATQEKNNLTKVTIKLREVVGYDLRQEGNYIFLDFRPPVGQLTVPGAQKDTPKTAPQP